MAVASTPPRRNRRASLRRLWLIRLGSALAAGLAIGATIGVVGVNTIEPGRPQQADSLQIMLDSIAQGQTPAGALDTAAADVAPGAPAADSTLPGADSSIVVPDLVGVEEGAARTALADAGFAVGGTEFRASRSPTGTVLATSPAFGTAVARGTTVSLILSDGRAPADSVTPHEYPFTP